MIAKFLNKKKVFIVSSLILMLVLSSCVKVVEVDEEGEPIVEKTVEFQDEFVELLGIDIIGAIAYLDSNIDELGELESTKAVEALLFTLHSNIVNNNPYVPLLEYGQKNKILKADYEEAFMAAEDDNIVNLYSDMSEKLYSIRLEDGEEYITDYAFVDLNYDRIVEKYRDYIFDDLTALTEYYGKENVRVYNEEATEFLYDKALENILNLEILLLEYEDSPYKDEFKQNLEFMYQLYFGYVNDGFDIFNEDGKIMDKALSHYKLALNQNEGTVFAERMSSYLDILKEEEYRKTANIDVFIIDLLKED